MSVHNIHRSRVSAEVPGLSLPLQRGHGRVVPVPEQRQVCKSSASATQTTWRQRLNDILSVQRVSQTATTDPLFPQDEKRAYDYQLSADRKFVAFMSNYSKVS